MSIELRKALFRYCGRRYLRVGGNLFYLSKILGHTSVKATERYLQSLGIEDL